MSSKLFRLPEVFLLDPGDEVAELVDRKSVVLDDLVQSGSERLVVRVHEDVVDTAVFKQVFLKTRWIGKCYFVELSWSFCLLQVCYWLYIRFAFLETFKAQSTNFWNLDEAQIWLILIIEVLFCSIRKHLKHYRYLLLIFGTYLKLTLCKLNGLCDIFLWVFKTKFDLS